MKLKGSPVIDTSLKIEAINALDDTAIRLMESGLTSDVLKENLGELRKLLNEEAVGSALNHAVPVTRLSGFKMLCQKAIARQLGDKPLMWKAKEVQIIQDFIETVTEEDLA